MRYTPQLYGISHLDQPMTLVLSYRSPGPVPVEIEGVTPQALRGETLDEIRRRQIFQGNRKVALGDFFAVSGDSADESLRLEGELSGVHWVGAKMQRGQIYIDGDVGRHVGSEMTGGRIEVAGNAGDWLGGEMHGGRIRVRGRAGHLTGAAYRGSSRGMTGGTILVAGDVGNEIGHTMRRGLLVVGGNVGDLAAFNMLAGTILICGEGGIRHAAGMKRGTLAFLGQWAPELLPTFRFACRYQPTVLTVLLRELRLQGFPVGDDLLSTQFDLYNGDLIEGGRGEILIRADDSFV